MQMDNRIILAGQPVNLLAALDAGTQAAGNAAQVQQAGRLASLYNEQGPGIMAGDQNALNALSRIDPMAGLGIQETRQGMRIREEQLQLARAAGARAAQTHAASLSAEQRAREAATLQQGLTMAIPAIQSGDLNRVNEVLQMGGIDPVGSIDEARLMLAQAEGAFETLQRYQEMTQPARVQPTDDIREYQFAVQNGFGGTFQDWMTRNAQTVQFTGPDGTTFTMGPGGQQQIAGPETDLPAPITAPVEGARQTFGFPSVFQGAANTVADAVGVDMPFPEQDEALAQVRLTQDALLQELAEGYDRPPLELLRSIRENIPAPGRLFQGPSSAINRYNAIRTDFEAQLAIEQRARTQTRDPRQLSEINRRVSALRNSIARIDRILEGMNPGAAVSDDDAALIQRYLD